MGFQHEKPHLFFFFLFFFYCKWIHALFKYTFLSTQHNLKTHNQCWAMIRCSVGLYMHFLLCNYILCEWVHFNYHIHLRCVKSNVSHPEGDAHHFKHLLGTLCTSTYRPLQPQTLRLHDLYHTRYSIDFNDTFIDMCITVYILCIIAVWVGTTIMPRCLFDMQRSAVEQLHGLC